MSVLTVPDALSASLAAATGPVELQAADGRRLGRFVPDPDLPPAEQAPAADIDPLTIPFHRRGPDLRMRAALAAIRALGPRPPAPVNDQDLRDARAGEMYGDPE